LPPGVTLLTARTTPDDRQRLRPSPKGRRSWPLRCAAWLV